ncbi:MAG: 6-hydroxymethylpterin diphosphokinase MptE-like protein [Brevinematia bacterium]
MIEICKAENGNLTIKKDGRFLISNYNPIKEINRFLDTVDFKKSEFYILFGIALGYLPEEIEKRGVSSSEILIFLPIEEEKKFLNEKYTLLTEKNLPALLEKKLSEGKKPKIIALESYKKALFQEFNTFENSVISNLKIAVENIKVTSFFSRIWFFNILRNLILALRNDWKYLEIKCKTDLPVLICAAGPSLNLKLKEIKENRENIIILSVLSAFETLNSNGIKPDGIIITDGGVANSLYFRNIPSDILVFADICASSSFLSKLRNKVIILNLKEEIENPTFQLQEPSVSVTAAKLARMITNSKVIFSGFDMAYSLKYGGHSFPNVFSLPHLKKFYRLNPVENHMFSFLKRDDIIFTGNRITNRQFLLLSESVKQLLSDCYYLENEVTGKSLKPIEKENLFLPENTGKDFTGEIIKKISKFLEFISLNRETIIENLLLKERLKNLKYDKIKENLLEKITTLIKEAKMLLQD